MAIPCIIAIVLVTNEVNIRKNLVWKEVNEGNNATQTGEKHMEIMVKFSTIW